MSTAAWPHTTHGPSPGSGSNGRNRIVAFVSAFTLVSHVASPHQPPITNTGKTIATWGEGNSYTGPGGTWVNRQT